MPAVVTFDVSGPLRIVEISAGGDNELTWLEIYSEWKAWAALTDNLKYPPAFRAVGGDPTSPSSALGISYFLQPPWKFKPAELDHRLVLVGNTRYEGGLEPTVVPTDGAYTVLVENEVSNISDTTLIGAPTIAPTQQEIRDSLKLAATGGAPDSGSVDSRLDTIDTTIAETKTRTEIVVAYAEGTSTLRITAWMVRDGDVVTSPTAISITWRDTDSSILFALTEADAEAGQGPDAQGNYVFVLTQALADDVTYPVDVTITDGAGPRADRHGLQTIKGT